MLKFRRDRADFTHQVRSPLLLLGALARIARLSKDPEFAELPGARRSEDALAILERIELRR